MGRYMKKLGIHSVIRKKKKKYIYAKPDETAENILQRDFYATVPNQKWATDVTEFKVPGEKKKLYLSAIIDLYDRYPVAYVVSARNDNRLIFKTFDKAIAANPDAKHSRKNLKTRKWSNLCPELDTVSTMDR